MLVERLVVQRLGEHVRVHLVGRDQVDFDDPARRGASSRAS